jgi:1,2-diacylglycerol 3-beta-galactosyltransferase
MSDTGGGHRASANALRDAFDELYPGQIEVDIVDIFTDYGPFFPFDSFVPIYKIMAEYPILWEIAFKSGETPLGLWLNEVILELFCFEPFKKCMTRPSGSSGKRADMVVSVHPLTQDIPLKILNDVDSNGSSRNEGRVTPFATVVTDLAGAYPAWFNPKVDKCFVPSDVLNQAARKRGLTSEQLVQYGLPIRKGFWAMKPSPMARASNTGNFLDDLFAAFGGGKKSVESNTQKTASNSLKTTLQGKLGMKEGLPTVLIVGGGDGMGGIIQQAKAMGDKLSKKASEDGREYQMVVVCGNNKKAQESLSANEWGEGVAVTVNGFVNNMDEWMRSSDVIVTKAGPGTIAEASICGLPCMLSSFL